MFQSRSPKTHSTHTAKYKVKETKTKSESESKREREKETIFYTIPDKLGKYKNLHKLKEIIKINNL